MKTARTKFQAGKASAGKYPLQVLVVEDHPDLGMALKQFFRWLGYQVHFAEDAASALAAARSRPFDVLLSDLGLPDATGWELLRQMQAAGCCPPVAIAMSGWDRLEHVAASQAAGFSQHLIKPFAPAALESALAEAEATLMTGGRTAI